MPQSLFTPRTSTRAGMLLTASTFLCSAWIPLLVIKWLMKVTCVCFRTAFFWFSLISLWLHLLCKLLWLDSSSQISCGLCSSAALLKVNLTSQPFTCIKAVTLLLPFCGMAASHIESESSERGSFSILIWCILLHFTLKWFLPLQLLHVLPHAAHFVLITSCVFPIYIYIYIYILHRVQNWCVTCCL